MDNRVLVPELQRLDAVRRLEHAVSLPFQHHARQHPNAGLVLDEQDGLGAAARRRLGFRFVLRPPRVSWSAGRHTLNVVPWPISLSTADRAAVLLDDAEDGGQAEPGALARRLGREERLEDVGQVLRRNAGCRCR